MNEKVVVIGGGTGISAILRGVKKYSKNISAIVAMTDDGGGSGMLRDDLGMLPPGDVRNCLVALANTEPAMEKLFQYRFDAGSLEGQNFGNIFIAALNNIYGNFDSALREIGNVLKITGRVIPVTLDNVHLVAKFANGDKCLGESIIPKMSYKLDTEILEVSLFPEIPKANKKAIDAILKADKILLGPGSLYTSIIPNLVVEGISQALYDTKAEKIYIANAMTQRGETNNYSIRDHILAIEKHSFKNILNTCLINDHEISKDILDKYLDKDKSKRIELTKRDIDFLNKRNIKLVVDDFIEEVDGFVRHSGEKVARRVINEA